MKRIFRAGLFLARLFRATFLRGVDDSIIIDDESVVEVVSNAAVVDVLEVAAVADLASSSVVAEVVGNAVTADLGRDSVIVVMET